MLVRGLVILFMTGAIAPAEELPTKQRKADQAQVGEGAGWMRRVGEQQHVLTNQRVNRCFVGDSLIEYWPGTAKAGWKEMEVKWATANLGIAGDRTEQVLYRIKALDFSRAKSKVVVLWVGTNNLSVQPADSPEEVAKAVLLCARQLHTKMPKARVFVIGLAPNGVEVDVERQGRIREVNRLLGELLDKTSFQFVPVYSELADEEGRWRPGLSTDGTHLSAKGYEVVGNVLLPLLEAAMTSAEAK